VEVDRITPGLWRWTGYHDEWKEDVGCVYCETGDGVVLIDPLIPPEESNRFLSTLDREVEGKPVHVLVTVFWHTRSAAAMVERYGARVWAPKAGKAAVARRAGDVTDPFSPDDRLPGGLEAYRTARAAEVVYCIPEHSALVPGDVLLGDGKGGARMCPESWLPASKTHRDLAASLRPLLDLPIERILVSHGEPVLENGRAALAAALNAT
jgi:glyoxylase-like metal-dependent hydrolase (beta-lactamase superfamily II)